MRGRQILPTKQQRLLSSYPLQSAEKVRTLSGKHTYFYFLQKRALTTLLLFSGGPVPRDPGGHPGHNSGRVVERQEERGPRPHVHGGGRRQQHSGRGARREKGGDWANCVSVSVLTVYAGHTERPEQGCNSGLHHSLLLLLACCGRHSRNERV